MPAYEAAALELGAKVRFAVIDVDQNKDLTRRFKITRLPELKFFQAGYASKTDEKVQDYTGGRSEYELKLFGKILRSEYDRNPELYDQVQKP